MKTKRPEVLPDIVGCPDCHKFVSINATQCPHCWSNNFPVGVCPTCKASTPMSRASCPHCGETEFGACGYLDNDGKLIVGGNLTHCHAAAQTQEKCPYCNGVGYTTRPTEERFLIWRWQGISHWECWCERTGTLPSHRKQWVDLRRNTFQFWEIEVANPHKGLRNIRYGQLRNPYY